MKKAIIISIIMGFCFVAQACAFWVWSPETGKWVNPKYAVKQSPKQQLEFAMESYKQAKFEKAIREFKQLIKSYPKANEAAEAQYFIGRSLEDWVEKDIQEQKSSCEKNPRPNCESQEKLWYRAKYYRAYNEYQLAIDKYAFTKHFEDVIEREYKIAEWFISESKKKILGMTFELEDPAVKILRKIVENAPYNKIAPQAQYSLGIYLKAKGSYQEAQDELEKVVNNYPESEWVEPAKYQIASCISSISPEAPYDQNLTGQAREKFQEFVKVHPDAELSKDAQKQVDQLKEKEARSNFDIAKFYQSQKNFESAKMYYKFVVENYPDSIWSGKAKEALRQIETKGDSHR